MQRHVVIWLILVVVCILALPAISTPTDIMGRVVKELGMIEAVFGKAETGRLTARATAIYNAVFVESGLVGASKKAMVSEDEKQASQPVFGHSVRGIADRTNDYILGVSALAYAALVRIVIFLVWLPYIAPFFIGVVVDALVVRKVKFATFGYSSPIRFAISAHSMIVVGFLPVLYLVVPLPVTPLFLPFWLLLSAVPIMTLLSNTQRI